MGLAVTVTFQVACDGTDAGSDQVDDDASGGAGAGYATTTSTTAYAVSTYATGPTTSSGGGICDTGIAGDYHDGEPDPTCQSCIGCTYYDACYAEWSKCMQGSGEPCELLLTCGGECRASCDANSNGMIDPDTPEESCAEDCWSGRPTCEASCDSVAMGGNDNGVVDPAEEACVEGCTGGPGTCIGDHAQGLAQYDEALTCSVCLVCATNCNAARNCH